MKTNFSYNLLKHLRRKQAEGGFTLIELLVVIIIIGILAAIALPSFLNQANRARETQATNNLGAASRAQQAYYLEFVEFSDDIENLDVGMDVATQNYNFADAPNGTNTGQFDIDPLNAVLYAAPQKALRGYAGVAYIYTENNKNSTGAKLCAEPKTEAKDAAMSATVTKATNGAEAECGANLEEQ